MSFASYCKDEASNVNMTHPTCKMAMLEALLRLNSEIVRSNGHFVITFLSSNMHVASTFKKLIMELYNTKGTIFTKESNKLDKKPTYVIEVIEQADTIITDMSLFLDDSPNHNQYEENECCIKSYLRGAFMARGSVNDPSKSQYHLEIATRNNKEAVYIQHLMNKFDLNAKISKRRNDYIIYLKEIGRIKDFLRIIGISQMTFKLEEVQIQREFKNDLNRKVNSEIANEMKTLDAAKLQLKNIQILEYNYPLEKMDPKILLIMKVRKDNPEASFQELLTILNDEYNEKITKSGLNHRFRKIKELADEIIDLKK